jgi:hypothetical protein
MIYDRTRVVVKGWKILRKKSQNFNSPKKMLYKTHRRQSLKTFCMETNNRNNNKDFTTKLHIVSR